MDVPAIKEQRVLASQTVQETVQVPQVQVINEIVQVLQATRRQTPAAQTVWNAVEVY